MIADLNPYPAMKNSGVPWLGEVPEHWTAEPIGQIGQLFKGNGGNKGDELPAGVPCVRYGDLYTRHEFFIRNTKACVSEERASDYTPIRYSDLLFAASGETVEDIGRSAVNLMQGDARCGGDVLLLRLKVDAVAEFLGYAADSVPSRHQKACMGRGFTVVHIYSSQLKRLVFPLPPLPEQAAIVRFLDYADRRIRRYVRAKQRLIELLEEQKQAIIHRAVTRGLDPNVRLKPSGVEWLGDVPEHWEVVTLRRVILRAVDGPHHSPAYLDEGVPFISARNIKPDRWSLEDAKFISEDDYDAFCRRVVPEIGDVLYTKGGTTGVARAVDLDFPFQVWVHVAVLKLVKSKVLPEFLARALNSPRCYEQAQLFTRGATNQDLGLGRMKGIVLALPPLDEQAAIVEYLDTELHRVGVAVRATRDEISLLREYRTRLIADVVTGKLDVREAAARLPDEVEDAEPLDEGDALTDAEVVMADHLDAIPDEAEA
jgi:type I restriction enzyme S subunit